MTLRSELSPYGIHKSNKASMLLDELNGLNSHHYSSCKQYKKLIDTIWHGRVSYVSLEDLPYLPVRIFKHHDLISVPQQQVVKTMTSSGTSGQMVSRIFLDKTTASRQVKVLSEIIGDFIGAHRLPMLVIDAKGTLTNRFSFSARAAGILGFSMFGRDPCFALDDDMSLNVERVTNFLQKYENSKVLLFGFTAIVWERLIKCLESTREPLPLSRGILIHGGGWKKLNSQAVTNEEFKKRLCAVTGISAVHNYYGMVEQTGSIFMECDADRLHVSRYSHLIVRDPVTLKPLGHRKIGLIQILSNIPYSYPGHSLLTEDRGELLGEDDCPCGRLGQTFRIHGRLAQAEVRGCSDTYTSPAIE
jgi:phenylacetate-coenzyme A ligase PaaK-like adenylate-forming protein